MGTRPASLEETKAANLGCGYVFTHDPLLRSRTLRRFTEPDILECITAIPCAVLFIYAGTLASPYKPVAGMALKHLLWALNPERGIGGAFARSDAARSGLDQRKQAFRDFRELYIEGEGHHVHLEAPHKVLPAILKFLQDPDESVHEPHHARL